MFGIGTQEVIIFGIISLVLFGNRLPSVGRSMGRSITECKKGVHDFNNDCKYFATLASSPWLFRTGLFLTVLVWLLTVIAVWRKM
jgi:sec-independent protein translocase protein TatA